MQTLHLARVGQGGGVSNLRKYTNTNKDKGGKVDPLIASDRPGYGLYSRLCNVYCKQVIYVQFFCLIFKIVKY